SPILGNFGEDDRGIPAASVREFEKACKAAGKSVDIKLYPGAGHAFINENTGGYRAAAAQDAWTRTFAFFEKTLKK
ncbi:MAG: dienelactone hydrolase family protein, partial [Candidatus Latescibacteria bacterium]|nr:dienelactone hydrolase family protein [Candidatus Latescibacterota bacterium]